VENKVWRNPLGSIYSENHFSRERVGRMFHIDINGTVYAVQEDRNLLDFLRDEAKVTSLKNGCGEGSCGACMLMVDGGLREAFPR